MSLLHVTYITIVLAATATLTTALEGYLYPAPIVKSQENDQYFTQDAYGQYSYGYNAPHSTKQEVRTVDGVTRGRYSYLDAAGKWQTVEYIADANGFRVVGTNLPRNDLIAPEPVKDTSEVATARALHLAAHEQLKLRASSLLKSQQPVNCFSTLIDDDVSLLPQPVQDTAEVAAAKAEFFKQYAREQQRHKLIHEQQTVTSSQNQA